MSTITVEQRLRTLETRLDLVQRVLDENLPEAATKKQGWPAIVGTFADDPLYDEAMRLAREWRNSQHSEPTESAN